MPPIILWLLQGVFLLLLYVFVWRAVRAVVRDLRTPAPAGPRPTPRRRVAPEPAAAPETRRRAVPSQLVVHFPDGRPRVIELTEEPVLFGRSPSCTVRLDDPYVSDDHARIYKDSSGWMVKDLKSTNGTFLNRVKVTAPAQIAAGDQLGIGKTIVEVRK
ncbi:MAG TPA: FHA domain-containing protein [Euzebyales bacterium]|nr:FHA domain-containing protein [Euzebyales bacterium]